VPWGQAPWAQPLSAGPAQERQGSPWLVVLTVGLALLVLALVAVGLRAAGGRTRDGEVVEVPARRDAPPTTSVPRSASPSTTTPSVTVPQASPPARIDTDTPRRKATDIDGRFEITVPRTWANLPTPLEDQNQWVPYVPGPNGDLVTSELTFVVRWSPTEGCTLERCAEVIIDRVKTTYAGVTVTTASDTVGGLPAVRIEATTPDQRLVAWVVVKGDRYWVPQLRGPPAEFDEVLAVASPVVASMSFP